MDNRKDLLTKREINKNPPREKRMLLRGKGEENKGMLLEVKSPPGGGREGGMLFELKKSMGMR